MEYAFRRRTWFLLNASICSRAIWARKGFGQAASRNKLGCCCGDLGSEERRKKERIWAAKK
jgi:hypothetical protein